MHQNKYKLILALLAMMFVPVIALAQTINSGNYQIEDSTFDSGTDNANSANYGTRDSVGDVETGNANSTNYKNPSGFQPGAYPGIPGTPTLVNTGGTLFDSLDFVVSTGAGQQGDTNYAIAISSDNFVTTNFIQTDDTVGATEAWQDYAGWNSGTGERVTGLSLGTTYKIKVKARYGPDSESGYSQTATATTSNSSLTVTLAGLSSGTTVAGLTTTVSANSNAINFGQLTVGDANPNIAAQRLSVTTNAAFGYTTTLQQDQNLTSGINSIPTVTGTNASPAAFDVGVVFGRFGYHTTDTTLCTGTGNRFTADDTYAALDTTAYEIACNPGTVSGEQTDIVYKLVVGTSQPDGTYQNALTYITTATY